MSIPARSITLHVAELPHVVVVADYAAMCGLLLAKGYHGRAVRR